MKYRLLRVPMFTINHKEHNEKKCLMKYVYENCIIYCTTIYYIQIEKSIFIYISIKYKFEFEKIILSLHKMEKKLESFCKSPGVQCKNSEMNNSYVIWKYNYIR